MNIKKYKLYTSTKCTNILDRVKAEHFFSFTREWDLLKALIPLQLQKACSVHVLKSNVHPTLVDSILLSV